MTNNSDFVYCAIEPLRRVDPREVQRTAGSESVEDKRMIARDKM